MMTAADAKRREERVKLAGTFASNLGVASAVTGVIGPLFLGRFDPLGVLLGTALAAIFHLTGQSLLHYVASEHPKEQA